MPKDYFQDITPPGTGSKPESNPSERTIRNIPIAPRRERGAGFPNTNAESVQNTSVHASMRESVFPNKPRFRFPIKRIALWGSAAVAVLALLFVVFAMLQGTSVVVTPRTHNIVLTEDVLITAYPAGDERAVPGTLSYEMGERSYDAEQTITASGYSEVEEYASGVITVYNEHGANSVRLIKNTRFETPSGLVFRIRDSIVVPGKKSGSPGTITVTVYADQPGERYNIPATNRFTLPGLKGGEMYNNIYGRSSAAFTGGFVGSKPKVAEADLERARATMRSELEQKARADMAAMAVSGKLVFPQLLMFTFESLPFDVNVDGKTLVRERIVAKLPVFPEELFAKVLATATRADGGETAMYIQDAEKLQVRSIASATGASIGEGPLDILVSGSANLVWRIDTDALAQSLAGTSKAETAFDSLINGFPSIEEADALIRPFWRSTFPSDPADIEVVISNL